MYSFLPDSRDTILSRVIYHVEAPPCHYLLRAPTAILRIAPVMLASQKQKSCGKRKNFNRLKGQDEIVEGKLSKRNWKGGSINM